MIVGIDIGATKTQLGRLDGAALVKSAKIPTDPDPDRFLRDLRRLLLEFLGPDHKHIEAIGVGAPGPLDPGGGVFGALPNLPRWEGFAFGQVLASRYDAPVRIRNDANAAALGEAIHGGGRKCRSVYYLTLSTGIGGGYVLDRRIVAGAHHLTGEIWALPVMNLGQPDILLNSSSGPGIVRTARMLLDRGHTSTLADLKRFDTEEVFRQARDGDALSRRVVENAAANLAYAVVSILLIVDPEIILLGGGMARDDECLIEPIKKALPGLCRLEEHRRLPVRKAELWDEAVLYGAVSLFDDG